MRGGLGQGGGCGARSLEIADLEERPSVPIFIMSLTSSMEGRMDAVEEIRGLAINLIMIRENVRLCIGKVLNCKDISDAEPYLREVNDAVDTMILVLAERVEMLLDDVNDIQPS